MSVSVTNLITNFDTYLGDSSTDRVSTAQRYQYLTEATVWLQEQLRNDHQVKTYDISYVDTVHYYRVTTPLADLLEGSDLRRGVGENLRSMTHKSSRELAEEVANGVIGDDSWAIERRDGQSFLVINATPKFSATNIDSFETEESIDAWVADTTNSDAVAPTLDANRYSEGSHSLNFDIDVSQSGNNRATLINQTLSLDLQSLENIGVFLLDVDIPLVTEVSSYTLIWGNSSTNYWTVTVDTDMDGSPLVNGFNTLAFEWSEASTVGTPDATSDIDYWRIDLNYTGSQTDDTDFRLDNFRVAVPETLKFHYVSWDIGTTSGGTELSAFSAGTDVPFFSGQYDQYKFAVAHMAASFAFDNLRLKDDATKEERRAYEAMKRAQSIFPKSANPEVKSFKVHGINLSTRRRFNNR